MPFDALASSEKNREKTLGRWQCGDETTLCKPC